MNTITSRSTTLTAPVARASGTSHAEWLHEPPRRHATARDIEHCPLDLGSPCIRSIRMLRLAQVIDATGLGRSKIYQLQAQGNFPKGVKIASRSVGWVEAEVQAWLARRIAENGASEA